MNRRLVSPLIPILGCCWLVCCDGTGRDRTPQQTEHAQSRASAEQQPSKNAGPSAAPDAEGEITVQIQLGDSTDNPTLNFNEPIDVVLTNQTDRSLYIWSPNLKCGWYELSFNFVNVRSGVSHAVRKQPFDVRHFRVDQGRYEEGDPVALEIPPHEDYTIPVTFNQGIWDGSAWTGLPSPLSLDQFSVTAQFEIQKNTDQNNYKVWAGSRMSKPVVVRVSDPSVETANDALRNGYVDLAIKMLEDNPWMIAGREPRRTTALHVAAWHGHLPAVRWLLDHDADVNATTESQLTPLHMAVSSDVVRLILAKNPDLTKIADGRTPLRYAAEKLVHTVGTEEEQNWRDIVDLYLGAGAEVDFKTAILLDDFDRVKIILEKSPKLAVDGIRYPSPLRLAASLGRLEICRYLIEQHHVDVNEFEQGGGYPIITVALAYPRIVEALIANGADLKTRISWQGASSGVAIIGREATVLHFAAQDGVPETIRILIDSGVDIYSSTTDLDGDDNHRNTALEVAAYCGAADNAAAIIDHPKFAAADPTVQQADLDHCLFIGVYSPFVQQEPGRLKLVRLLLEKGANPNVTKKPDPEEFEDGITVLQAAAHGIDPDHTKKNSVLKDIVNLLKAHGATMDLASAVAIGDIDEVRRFLKNNPELANPRRPDGYPALQLAIELDDKLIVQALLDAGGNIDIRNQAKSFCNLDGTGLHSAAFWRRPELASLLIDAGADVNARDARGCTPLHEAAQMEDIRMTKLLLEHGADPDVKDNAGETPLDSFRKSAVQRPKEKEKYIKEMESIFREHQSRQGH